MSGRTVCICVQLVIFAASSARSGGNDSERHKSFADVEEHAARLESPRRAEWQRPDEVVRMMGLRNGDVVADVGAGTGYFARRIAKAVGPDGSVTGYDIEKNMVEFMRRDAKILGLTNYRAEVVAAKDPCLPRNRFDVIFMCNTYHHISERVPYLRALSGALKGSGRIVLVDQKMEAEQGPPRSIRIGKGDAIAEFASAGFVLIRDKEFLPDQYYLEFRAK